jgi:hypothetical protein
MNYNTTLQQRTIQQNNDAVAMIESGNYHHAVTALSGALKDNRLLLNQVNDQQQEIKTSMDQCMAQSRPTSDHSLDQNGRFLYRHAIRVPVNVEFHYRAAVMIGSMIIFNLALAHQLSAAVSDKNRESTLCRAAKFYELALNMQIEECFDSNILFTLATVNNLGLIHHQLDDTETASKCFEHLLSTLMFLVDCGEGHTSDLEGFLRNASTVNFQACPAAAA